ncbi:MAG: Uma2 family endonuclease [Roseiflexaceae bacterium]|nr:Uma2 family endonuclease [Roseiflexaceae bacterium]
MAIDLQTATIVYPTSDGEPMADNTKQFRWIVTIKGGLDTLFMDRADVFVAADLLWYPVEGEPGLRRAADAMVVFGRPKGDRGAYMQWLEDDIAPQVVFEVLSPGNTLREMSRKLAFYDMYGVDEYYLYDPDKNDLAGWVRANNRLLPVEEIEGWASPRLNVRFTLDQQTLHIIRPDGSEFLDYIELERRREAEHTRAEREYTRAEQERTRADLLAERLRALGVNPDDVLGATS